jgi:hypothetical protein
VFKLFTLENEADAFLIGFSHMECEKNNNAPTLNPPSSEKKAFVLPRSLNKKKGKSV